MNVNTMIIAEAGVNHNGSLLLAKRLIDEAANAGADAVKFQTFKSEKVVTKIGKKANYQIDGTSGTDSQLEMIRELELSDKSFHKLETMQIMRVLSSYQHLLMRRVPISLIILVCA